MVATTDNLAFSPHPIEAVGLRAGEGPAVQVQKAIVQRTTALRAYNTFSSGRDWMENCRALTSLHSPRVRRTRI